MLKDAGLKTQLSPAGQQSPLQGPPVVVLPARLQGRLQCRGAKAIIRAAATKVLIELSHHAVHTGRELQETWELERELRNEPPQHWRNIGVIKEHGQWQPCCSACTAKVMTWLELISSALSLPRHACAEIMMKSHVCISYCCLRQSQNEVTVGV